MYVSISHTHTHTHTHTHQSVLSHLLKCVLQNNLNNNKITLSLSASLLPCPFLAWLSHALLPPSLRHLSPYASFTLSEPYTDRHLLSERVQNSTGVLNSIFHSIVLWQTATKHRCVKLDQNMFSISNRVTIFI